MNKLNYPQQVVDYFWNKVTYPGNDQDCWEWCGTIEKEGYGVFSVNHKQLRVHRFSWEYYNGSIPNNLFVCHKCDNPPCVNPDHLFLGSLQDNEKDKVQKDRHVFGSKNGRAVLTEEVIIDIITGVLNKTYLSIADIVDKYKVNPMMIRYIFRRKNWTRVTDTISDIDLKTCDELIFNLQKTKQSVINQIKNLSSRGFNGYQISKQLNISTNTIYKYLKTP